MLRLAEKGFRGLLDTFVGVVWPDDCRICGVALQAATRVPVCGKCVHEPQPLIAEYFCATCRAPFLNKFPLDENGQCMLCRLGLNGFDAVYSYGSYEGTLRKLVHLLKYDGMLPLAQPLAKHLATVMPKTEHFDYVVPVPMHWRRRFQRGFNQSELLAGEIARRWNVPVCKAVRRTKATAAQVRLTNAKRRANLAGAFALRAGVDLTGKRVLLIDDVLTTGATAAACARVLKRAGAAHVALATVARTDRRMSRTDFTFQESAKAATAAGSDNSGAANL